MKRVFGLILICAFATACASGALAQSRRVWRTEPPREAAKPETKDEAQDKAQDEAKNEAKDEAKESSQDGARADDEEASLRGEITERAIIKSKPNPRYPPEARSYGVRGVVKLRIILGSDGKVRDKIEVIEGLPHGVTEEAIKAARKIKFEPARKDGRPVSRYVTVVYHFNLY
jgi:TonB family protein